MNMEVSVCFLLLLLGALTQGDTLSESSCSPEELACDQKRSAADSSLWREDPAASGSEETVRHQDDNTKTTFSGSRGTPDTLRMALVGKTGSGKSSTGNTILGRKAFKAKLSSTSITKNCSKAEAEVDGRRVAVVDTPGLFDTSLSNEDIIREKYKSVSLLAPGPHAFLLLVPIGRFTEEEKHAVKYIKAAFGKEAEKYILILFTRGDELEDEGQTIEEYVRNADPALKEFVAACGNRFHVFNNKDKDRTQVKELLQKIDFMVWKNGGSYYTNDMLKEAEEAIQKEVERLMKEKEQEIRRKEEEIKRKYQEEMEKILQMEKQKQEEENRQREKQFQDKEDEMKREKERQKKREEEFKERERRREEETEKLKRKYEEEARRQAEESNSFLDKILSRLAEMANEVIDFFLNL